MLRRMLFALAISAMVVAPALPAGAATRDVKVPGTNWYWEAQTRVKTSDHVTCPDDAPACPSHQQELENPHSPGSLPVQVLRGEDEKISAIEFDLSFIPIQGATIQKFSFTIIESQTEQDRHQTLDASGKTIQACPIEESWASSLEGGATTMKERPKFAASGCVKGTRKDNASPPRWEFNITKLAAPWGDNPSSAYGVMLVGVKPDNTSESWQIVLRGPYRGEDSKTAGQNFIKTTVAYTPKPAPSFASYGSTTTSYPTTSTSTGFGFDGSAYDAGAAGSTPVFPPASGDATPGSAAVPFGGTVPTAAGSEEQPGGMPAYFWLIIPVALMAFSLVRHTILEPVGGKRPDGVVALIRRQNAARLGRPLRPDSTSSLAGVTRVFRTSGQRLRSVARRVVSGGKRR